MGFWFSLFQNRHVALSSTFTPSAMPADSAKAAANFLTSASDGMVTANAAAFAFLTYASKAKEVMDLPAAGVLASALDTCVGAVQMVTEVFNIAVARSS